MATKKKVEEKALVLRPQDDQEAIRLMGEAHVLSAQGMPTIQVKEDLITAKGLLVKTTGLRKAIEDKKKELIDPIKAGLLKPMEAFFKKILDPVKKGEEDLRDLIAGWEADKREEERNVNRILADSGVKTDMGLPMTVQTELETVEEVEGGKVVSTPKWEFHVEDYDSLPEDICRAACQTNRGKEAVDQVIRGLIAGGVHKIPGVAIKESVKLTVYEGENAQWAETDWSKK